MFTLLTQSVTNVANIPYLMNTNTLGVILFATVFITLLICWLIPAPVIN